MSRVGNAPITVPSGVEIAIDGSNITVKGSKGELSRGSPAACPRTSTSRRSPSFVPTTPGPGRSRPEPFTRPVADRRRERGLREELQIQGVGCPGQGLQRPELALGFSHPVKIETPEGVEFEFLTQTEILVKGIDKQLVGQVPRYPQWPSLSRTRARASATRTSA